MHFFGSCPQCGNEINKDRYINNVAVCECGWFDKTPLKDANTKHEKQTIRTMIGFSVFLVVLYAHLVSWGNYAVEIPFIKLAKLTRTLSPSGYHELAQVCIDLAKYDCAKDAYSSLYSSKNDLSGLAGLGRLQSRLGEVDAAASTFATYFRAGGNDSTAALVFARILEVTGRTQDALKFYEASIEGSGDLLPTQATMALVRLLMKQGMYEEAHSRIVAFHGSAGNAKGYLNTELQQLENYFKQNGRRKSNKRVASR